MALTALISIVFSRVFGAEIHEYAPYILSGVVVWEFLSASFTGGSLTFVQAAPYIGQRRLPLAIYPLRTVLGCGVVFAMGCAALMLWVLVTSPANFNTSWMSLLVAIPVLLLAAWPVATLLALIGARFRDTPQILALVMQGVWFVSPVFIQTGVFQDAGLQFLLTYNPVHHALQLIREPILHGQLPDAVNYIWVGATGTLFSLAAMYAIRKLERTTIHHL